MIEIFSKEPERLKVKFHYKTGRMKKQIYKNTEQTDKRKKIQLVARKFLA